MRYSTLSREKGKPFSLSIISILIEIQNQSAIEKYSPIGKIRKHPNTKLGIILD
jgi:hypothetical protein